MKIRVLLYKARIGDKHWLDDAISLWTGLFNWGTGPYSHVELWVQGKCFPSHCEDEAFLTFQDAEYPEDYYGTCYTATMRGKTKGVVKNPASKILKNPGRWDYCEIEVDKYEYDQILQCAEFWVDEHEGYDFTAILSFFWFWRMHDKNRWICSEFVYHLLLRGEMWGDFDWCNPPKPCPSPRRLSRWLTKKGYEIKPLSEV